MVNLAIATNLLQWVNSTYLLIQTLMNAALILVTLMPCVLIHLVHSPVLVTVDTLEMDSLVEVSSCASI